MASSHLSSLIITLAAFLTVALAQTASAQTGQFVPILTTTLEKGGQYTTLVRLLNVTQVGLQLQSQLNNSISGLTIFAPTDNAFDTLEPGTLNSLSNEDQVELILSHVLPRFYTLVTFQTASNPLQTQGYNSLGLDTINVASTTNNQIKVTTGVVETQVNNVIYSEFPLTVFSVDKVLLPNSLSAPGWWAGRPAAGVLMADG